MLFKDLKQGQSVHILDRKTAEYMTGSVVETPSLPHYDPRQPVWTVDIKISVKAEERVYNIPENLAVTYAGDLCLATDKSDLLAEVEQMARKADEAIADFPRQQEIKDKCDELKLELNPALKAQQETDERFKRIEDRQDKLMNMMERFFQNHTTNI